MVQLVETDIRTREVLDWKGLHVFHYPLSSCSQKLRIFLNLKGLDWRSHPIDIVANAHLTPYYLGINPRGLVPAIVEDGVVHIESNDIILHLEREHPEPRLVPAGRSEEVAAMLRHENDLHLDLRTLTFRFLIDPAHPTKSRQDLDRYAADAGTVRGARDRDVEREVSFWSGYLENGVSDQQARASAARLRDALDEVDTALAASSHVLGDHLSIVDVAWLVYVERLACAGYPIGDLHPHVAAWRYRLLEQSAIARELELPEALRGMIADRQRALASAGRTLAAVCFPEVNVASVVP
ncbi:glutathione S-transferase family protein [Methylobacterium sp. J-030]|uniref:glutathione S-transferase family protein n=1 Tax=Methylobacterium sp. J-030 TaxID=2836627 RepID=UPI001FBABC9C|nr:glutathione S-transferase family protein [Methylobacterium sp. J-030]MCJ2071327.1 glutathione S-transferase family protein [Methylobacterium sp. J-030]